MITQYPPSLPDNLCVFIALAQSNALREGRDVMNCVREVHELYGEWVRYCYNNSITKYCISNIDDFNGFHLLDLSILESYFDVSVNLYRLNPDKTVYSIHNSIHNHSSEIHLNMFHEHVNLITNIESFAKKYVCNICDTLFSHQGHLNVHKRICSKKSKHVFKVFFL